MVRVHRLCDLSQYRMSIVKGLYRRNVYSATAYKENKDRVYIIHSSSNYLLSIILDDW